MFRYTIYFIVLTFSISSCGLTDDFDQTASFLKINELSLVTQASQGAATENFKDVWVYANGALLGLYTPPAVIPVLSDSLTVDFLIFAGIRNNGDNTTPFTYPMTSSVGFQLDMIPGETVERDLVFEYNPEATFDYVEGFEGNLTFDEDTDQDSATSIVKSSLDSASGLYAGLMELSAEHPTMEVTSQFSFTTENILGTAYIELDYKNEADILLGITARSGLTVSNIDHIIIPARAEWNKIYIDITLLLRDFNVDEFKIYIRGVYNDESQQTQNVFIDNLKYIYF